VEEGSWKGGSGTGENQKKEQSGIGKVCLFFGRKKKEKRIAEATILFLGGGSGGGSNVCKPHMEERTEASAHNEGGPSGGRRKKVRPETMMKAPVRRILLWKKGNCPPLKGDTPTLYRKGGVIRK